MADEAEVQAPAPSEEAATATPEPQAAPSEPFNGAQDKPLATPEAEVQTAQIPADEPIAPEPESRDTARDKPMPTTEPPKAASVPVATHAARDLLVKARAMIQGRKRKKLEKILEVVNAKGKITNDEVEKLLHVSDATATRYLSALEKEGKIKQVGKTGTGVVYTKV